jgi:hypothetical protein
MHIKIIVKINLWEKRKKKKSNSTDRERLMLGLASERAPHMKKKESNCHSKKCKIWSSAQKGA